MTSAGVVARDLELPDEAAADQAARAVAQLTDFLRSHPTPTARVQLCTDTGEDDPVVVIPSVAFGFFVDVLAELANGNTVTVAPVHAEFTTQQAADFLNVSRPYVIRLLDEQQIPHRRVGNRRKVLLTDLVDYKRRDDRNRQAVLDQLTRDGQELEI